MGCMLLAGAFSISIFWAHTLTGSLIVSPVVVERGIVARYRVAEQHNEALVRLCVTDELSKCDVGRLAHGHATARMHGVKWPGDC